MRALFRVFPYLDAADDEEPGGALYVPPQGGGRIDNPGVYSVLYLSDTPSGAIAEAFGRFPEWAPAILEGVPTLPGSVRALARYRLADDARICDLNDAQRLTALGLRPTDVVTRDYAVSRGWARRLHAEHSWAGVQWWSYYNPAWASIGIWNLEPLTLERVTPLRLDDPDLVEASRAIVRRVIASRRK